LLNCQSQDPNGGLGVCPIAHAQFTGRGRNRIPLVVAEIAALERTRPAAFKRSPSQHDPTHNSIPTPLTTPTDNQQCSIALWLTGEVRGPTHDLRIWRAGGLYIISPVGSEIAARTAARRPVTSQCPLNANADNQTINADQPLPKSNREAREGGNSERSRAALFHCFLVKKGQKSVPGIVFQPAGQRGPERPTGQRSGPELSPPQTPPKSWPWTTRPSRFQRSRTFRPTHAQAGPKKALAPQPNPSSPIQQSDNGNPATPINRPSSAHHRQLSQCQRH
jgi:hypothetical protein